VLLLRILMPKSLKLDSLVRLKILIRWIILTEKKPEN